MLIYEKQGVVCVDGLVLGSNETHFGSDVKMRVETKLNGVTSTPPRVSMVLS